VSNVTVIGGGYVGLITSACFARLGHHVYCLENDRQRLFSIREGRLPIREPGLPEIWEQGVAAGRLDVTGDYEAAVPKSDFVFIAVGTPARVRGSIDLRQVVDAVRSILEAAAEGPMPVVVLKSTVPPGTAELIKGMIRDQRPHEIPQVVSNPEFLREGLAVIDFMRPARVVIGAEDRHLAERVGALYERLRRPVVYTSSRAAEVIKYASNAFLATKISFMNEIAALCEEISVDVADVSHALGMDWRIGSSYLDAGLGWGGSCLPKDLNGLIWTANHLGVPTPILRSAVKVNSRQSLGVVNRLKGLIGDLRGKRITVWGLSFKPNCDDIRESPALHLIRHLTNEGAKVCAYDPVAMDAAARHGDGIEFAPDPYAAADNADAVVLATAWPQFLSLDWQRVRAAVKRPLLLDARNALNVSAVTAAGLVYVGIGRPIVGPEFTQEPRGLAQHLRVKTRGRKSTKPTGRKR
jgi:UDPglucose 6-dehydrogenase